MPNSQTEDQFKNPWYRFVGEPMLFLLALEWNLKEKTFSCVKKVTDSNFAGNIAEMLNKGTMHFCLFDESYFSNICGLQYLTIECIEINLIV